MVHHRALGLDSHVSSRGRPQTPQEIRKHTTREHRAPLARTSDLRLPETTLQTLQDPVSPQACPSKFILLGSCLLLCFNFFCSLLVRPQGSPESLIEVKSLCPGQGVQGRLGLTSLSLVPSHTITEQIIDKVGTKDTQNRGTKRHTVSQRQPGACLCIRRQSSVPQGRNTRADDRICPYDSRSPCNRGAACPDAACGNCGWCRCLHRRGFRRGESEREGAKGQQKIGAN